MIDLAAVAISFLAAGGPAPPPAVIGWPPPESTIRAVLRSSLVRRYGEGSVHVDILEFSRRAICGDELDFPVSGLVPSGPGESGEFMWRGKVVLRSLRRTVPVWLRVRLRLEAPQWIASREIEPGAQISPADCRREIQRIDLRAGRQPAIGSTPAGQFARLRIRSGEVVTKNAVAPAPLARRGDRVVAQADRGQAHLEVEAELLADGFAGQTVRLRNPATGKLLQGRMDERGKVTVLVTTR